jgi:hypothetical protein
MHRIKNIKKAWREKNKNSLFRVVAEMKKRATLLDSVATIPDDEPDDALPAQSPPSPPPPSPPPPESAVEPADDIGSTRDNETTHDNGDSDDDADEADTKADAGPLDDDAASMAFFISIFEVLILDPNDRRVPILRERARRDAAPGAGVSLASQLVERRVSAASRRFAVVTHPVQRIFNVLAVILPIVYMVSTMLIPVYWRLDFDARCTIRCVMVLRLFVFCFLFFFFF